MSASPAAIRPASALLLPLLVAASTSLLRAQGPGLRSPQQSVFAAFPAADGYQAIVRNIDAAARLRIEGSLPFRVHFNDLGEHAVYVALRGRLPLGVVYVRGEDDAFGLTEIEWAITLDLRLAGFRFQRTRNIHRQAIETSEFARLLIGCSAKDLQNQLDPDGTLSAAARGVPPGTEALAAELGRSALKAITVVDTVWAIEVQKLHDLAIGMQAFPTAQRFVRIWPPTAVIEPATRPPPDPDDARSTVVAVRAIDRDARPLGVVASVASPAPAPAGAILAWTIDEAGVVVAATPWADAPAPLRAACQEVVGKPLAAAAPVDGPVGESARALLLVLQTAARPGR